MGLSIWDIYLRKIEIRKSFSSKYNTRNEDSVIVEIVSLLHVVNQTLFFLDLPWAYFHKSFDTMVTSEKCKCQINGYISLHKTGLSILLFHGILLNSSIR